MFCGSPVNVVSQMPNWEPGATPVAFGNWPATYLVVTRRATTMTVDPYSASQRDCAATGRRRADTRCCVSSSSWERFTLARAGEAAFCDPLKSGCRARGAGARSSARLAHDGPVSSPSTTGRRTSLSGDRETTAPGHERHFWIVPQISAYPLSRHPSNRRLGP